MKTAFGIFWHGVKQLVRNPLALVAALVLIVLSSAFAWYAISAVWNPYENTGYVKVAVVNEDVGVDLGSEQYDSLPESQKGRQLDIGAALVEGLREDDTFDWRFVDGDAGAEGLESGEFYAEFVIPEHFSADFLSVLTDEREHPKIEYRVNEKRNTVALEVTDTGASVMDAMISQVFADVLSDTTSGVVKDVAANTVKVTASSQSNSQLNLNIATSNVAEAAGKLTMVEKSIDQWVSKSGTIKGTLDSLKSSLPGLRTSVNNGITQLQDVRKSAHEVERAYSGSLTTTSETLPKAMKDASKSIKDIASEIGKQQGEIGESVEKAQQALETMGDVIDALKKLGVESDKVSQLEQQAGKLSTELDKIDYAGVEVEEAAVDAVSVVGEAAAEIDAAVKALQSGDDASSDDLLSRLDSGVDTIALVLGSLDGSVEMLYGRVDQAKSLLDGLDGALGQAKGSIVGVKSLLGASGEELRSARTSLASIADSDFMAHVSKLVDIDAKSYGSFMASPVSANVRPVYSVASYGMAMAPFYICGSLWISCLMLVLVVTVEVDPRRFARMRPWQGYVGRLLVLLVLELVQCAVVLAGSLALGVQPTAPVSFALAGLVTSLCFMSVVYAAVSLFKHVGTVLVVLLLVGQLSLAAGMYPLQLAPSFFQALYAWLPISYGMGSLREPLAGFYGNAYVFDLLWLLACAVVSAGLAIFARPLLRTLNGMFGRKLHAAGVFAVGEPGFEAEGNGRRPSLNALLGHGELVDELVDHARVFTSRYTVVKQLAPVIVVTLLLVMGVLGFLLNPGSDGKTAMLLAFVAALAVLLCVGLAMEARYDNLAAELAAVGVDIEEMHADRTEERDWLPAEPEQAAEHEPPSESELAMETGPADASQEQRADSGQSEAGGQLGDEGTPAPSDARDATGEAPGSDDPAQREEGSFREAIWTNDAWGLDVWQGAPEATQDRPAAENGTVGDGEPDDSEPDEGEPDDGEPDDEGIRDE